MKQLNVLIKRNSKLFFKDKGLFFTSLITPLILLVLFATFLGNVYRDSFLSAVEAFPDAKEFADGFAGAQLVSSLLAVSCVTVAFCSNMLMVQDKANGTIFDLEVAPLKRSKLALSYYISTTISTLLVCIVALLACFIYLACTDWYLSFADVGFLILDTVLLVSFGVAISSLINFFLSTQGQISVVGSIVSSCYGFLCGAYMPISQFSEGLQAVLSFLPFTYATSLFRNHAMGGVLRELENSNMPSQMLEGVKDGFDCNIYFFDTKVEIWQMYVILIVATLLLIGVYVLLNYFKEKKNSK